uniref:Uncharacterized protein n=1 Tax=viral metagenome TaxID=1070528 RepID=A0A6M3K8A1_9ZZZZ
MYLNLTQKKEIFKKDIVNFVKKYSKKEFLDLYITKNQRKEIDKLFKSCSWSNNVKKVDISKKEYSTIFIKIRHNKEDPLEMKEKPVNIVELKEQVEWLTKVVDRYIIAKEIQKHCQPRLIIEDDELDPIIKNLPRNKFRKNIN